MILLVNGEPLGGKGLKDEWPIVHVYTFRPIFPFCQTGYSMFVLLLYTLLHSDWLGGVQLLS